MSIDVKKLEALLNSYLSRAPNLISALVVDRDGLVIGSKVKKEESSVDEDLLSGISAIVEPILNKITREFKTGSFGSATFDTKNLRLVFLEAGSVALFITVADFYSNLDDIYPYAYLTAEKISRLFDNRSVSLDIPIINSSFSQKEMEPAHDGEIRQMKFKRGTYAFKLVIVGDGAVGKTTLVRKYVEKKFTEDYLATIGANIMTKECRLPGENVTCKFNIWDLASQDLFKRARKSYFSEASAGIIMFDVTRKATLEHVKSWMLEFQAVEKPIPIVLVGNKSDLVENREVTQEAAEELAKELNLSYIETSAKNGSNIEEVFQMLAYFLIKSTTSTILTVSS
ncbi:MAG TPA: GTP-binding protein [Candidatus Lokiarchaeia archaeon]|nr:GTP-binding protein [Candidatus Lokiarchaeia archaeon]